MKTNTFQCLRAIADGTLQGRQKQVAISLWMFCDRNGKCHPSVNSIGRRAGLKSRTSVKAALKELEAGGYITISRKANKSSQYTLKPGLWGSVSDRPAGDPRSSDDGRGSSDDGRGSICDPEVTTKLPLSNQGDFSFLTPAQHGRRRQLLKDVERFSGGLKQQPYNELWQRCLREAQTELEQLETPPHLQGVAGGKKR